METCNGLDEDCDGVVDEIAPDTPCDDGTCTGTLTCVDGVPVCETPTPTPETCNGLDDDCDARVDEGLFGPVGEPVLIRDDAMSTGDCFHCSWAHEPFLLRADDGLMAVWRLGRTAVDPSPNVVRRPLHDDGTPAGPPQLWRSADTILPVAGDAGFAIYASDRSGPSPIHMIDLLNRGGNVERSFPLFTTDGRFVAVWNGERFIAAFVSRVPPQGELSVRDMQRDGTLSEVRVLGVDQSQFRPRLAVSGRIVGLLTEHLLETSIGIFETDGHLLSYRSTALSSVLRRKFIGTDAGWMVIDYWNPTEVTRLDLDGNILDPATPYPDERLLADFGSSDTHLTLGRGLWMFAWQSTPGGPDNLIHIELYNASAEVIAEWAGPPPPDPVDGFDFFLSPRLKRIHDRILMVWTGQGPPGVANPVYFQEIGCVPLR